MRRREVIAGLAGVAAFPLGARAQESGRTFRIGMAEPVSAELNAAYLAAFRQELKRLGYVEGRNLVIEHRSADGDASRFPALLAELIALNVDLIVARGTPAALAAKKATSTIPVVIAVGEPLLVVDSLSRPGGNITGLSGVQPELETKRMELLKELAPTTSGIAALLNMGNPVTAPQLKALEAATKAKGWRFRLFDVRSRDDIERAFDGLDKASDAVVVGLRGLHRRTVRRCGACREAPAAGDLWRTRVRRGRRTDLLWAELHGHLYPLRHVCRQDIQGCQACRSAGRATHQARARNQWRRCSSARARNSSEPAAPR